MRPGDFLKQLWAGHRAQLVVAGLLLLANVALALALQLHFVPTVSAREQQLIGRQAELHGRSGESPAQLLAQGERDLAVFREQVPPYPEFTGLVAELQGLAEEAGLDLPQISYQHERDKTADLLRCRLTFAVTGAYRDIKLFIHALEQSPRLFIIGQIGLQGVGVDTDTDVRLQLDLETFFRPGVS